MTKELPIVPTAAPGSLAEISTAHSMREYRPIIINAEKITAQVYLFCPDGALSDAGGSPAVDLKLCKGCGICAAESEGIEMVLEYTGPYGIFGAKEVK